MFRASTFHPTPIQNPFSFSFSTKKLWQKVKEIFFFPWWRYLCWEIYSLSKYWQNFSIKSLPPPMQWFAFSPSRQKTKSKVHKQKNPVSLKANRIRLGTQEKVNKCRLHRRCLDDITTTSCFSGWSGSAWAWWCHNSKFLDPGHICAQADTLIFSCAQHYSINFGQSTNFLTDPKSSLSTKGVKESKLLILIG